MFFKKIGIVLLAGGILGGVAAPAVLAADVNQGI